MPHSGVVTNKLFGKIAGASDELNLDLLQDPPTDRQAEASKGQMPKREVVIFDLPGEVRCEFLRTHGPVLD